MTESAPSVELELETDRRDPSALNQKRRAIFAVPVQVTVSLGRKTLSVAEILDLEIDTIVPLSASVEDPIELIVDDCVIARGDLIEQEDGCLAIKITEVVDNPDEGE